MKIKNRFLCCLLAVLSAAICVSCHNGEVSQYADAEFWYQAENQYDTSKVDVIYFVSTNVLCATDENGAQVWQSQLTSNDKAFMDDEFGWVESNIFHSDFNMIAPYYHQFTFDAVCQLDKASFNGVYQKVSSEACEAFDYYMKHMNNGRPYILTGFSQGAMLTVDVLKHMTDEQYSRMIACYCIGYRLSAEDLKDPHIKAAQGEFDCGVTVSFNSSQTKEAIWPLVNEGAVTSINPVNWKTDSTPATFSYDGTTNTLYLDTLSYTLLVATDTPSYYYKYYDRAPFYEAGGVSRDNLHHWDLLFYHQQLHDNALNRANSFRTLVGGPRVYEKQL